MKDNQPRTLRGPGLCVFKNVSFMGAPGWLSQLSFRLWLRSQSHGLWVQAPHGAHCCQSGACFGSSVPLSLSPSPACTLSKINKTFLKRTSASSFQNFLHDVGITVAGISRTPPILRSSPERKFAFLTPIRTERRMPVGSAGVTFPSHGLAREQGWFTGESGSSPFEHASSM